MATPKERWDALVLDWTYCDDKVFATPPQNQDLQKCVQTLSLCNRSMLEAFGEDYTSAEATCAQAKAIADTIGQ